jgi:hypothetical protein
MLATRINHGFGTVSLVGTATRHRPAIRLPRQPQHPSAPPLVDDLVNSVAVLLAAVCTAWNAVMILLHGRRLQVGDVLRRLAD